MSEHPKHDMGREVSCRALGDLLDALREKGLPAETLADEVPHPIHHLSDKQERIGWGEYCALLRRTGHELSDDHWVACHLADELNLSGIAYD